MRTLYLPVYEIKLLKRIADEARARNLPILIAARKEMMETLSHCVHIESVQNGKDGSSQPGLWFIELTEEEQRNMYARLDEQCLKYLGKTCADLMDEPRKAMEDDS